jgi:hypothetical protein
MNLEDQVRLYKALSQQIEEMEEKKRALSLTIMQAMQEKTLKLSGFVVRCCSRLNIKVTLDEARSLNAVKLEEMVDKDKIKALCKDGQLINGVTEIKYIQVSSLEKNDF